MEYERIHKVQVLFPFMINTVLILFYFHLCTRIRLSDFSELLVISIWFLIVYFFIGINVSDLGIQLLDHWFSESPRRTLYKSLELVHFYFLLNLFKVFSELIVQNLFEVSLLYNFQVFILPFL